MHNLREEYTDPNEEESREICADDMRPIHSSVTTISGQNSLVLFAKKSENK